jgi:hypothetical protein
MRLIKTYLTYFLWILNSTHHSATIQMWFDSTIMQILSFDHYITTRQPTILIANMFHRMGMGFQWKMKCCASKTDWPKLGIWCYRFRIVVANWGINNTLASGRYALSTQEIIVYVPQDAGCAPPESLSMLWTMLRRDSCQLKSVGAFSRNLKLG